MGPGATTPVGVREWSPLTKDIFHKSITKKTLPNSNTLSYISLLSFLNFEKILSADEKI